MEREVEGFDSSVDGKALSNAVDELETLAGKLKVRPLLEFSSYDPAELEGIFGEAPGAPAQVWFNPEDGLATVRALHAAVSKGPYKVPNRTGVLEDLADFERVLSAAAAHGVPWCLQVDF